MGACRGALFLHMPWGYNLAMRILVVLSYYAPHWTGLTQYARRAAESWAALGHTVTVVTTRHDPALAATEIIGGVAVVRCGVVARVSRAAVAPALLPAVWAALADCDVAVVHTPLPEAGAVGQLCRWRRIPYLCIHHGDVVLPAGLRNARYSAAMRRSAQSAYATAAAVVTHSADYADHSTWLAPLRWRVTVVPPPVDLTPVGTRAAARAALGLPAEAYVVGFFGRRVVEKGFDRLTAIVPALRQRHPNLHIHHFRHPKPNPHGHAHDNRQPDPHRDSNRV